MVTVTCSQTDCPNAGIDYNVAGTPDVVECGGCHSMLEPYNERPDPPAPPLIPT